LGKDCGSKGSIFACILDAQGKKILEKRCAQRLYKQKTGAAFANRTRLI
jgi:hypothetical protein